MAQTWSNARLNPVYYRVGTFDGDLRARFVKAPFDAVFINGEVFLQPTAQCYSIDAIAQIGNSDSEQARLTRQEGGFYTDLNPIIVEEQEMGCKDDETSWKGMHAFGWI